MSYGVGCRCSSDPELLWLWCGPAAAAPIRHLAWELPYATSAALKRHPPPQKKKVLFRFYPPLWIKQLDIPASLQILKDIPRKVNPLPFHRVTAHSPRGSEALQMKTLELSWKVLVCHCTGHASKAATVLTGQHIPFQVLLELPDSLGLWGSRVI